MKKLILLAALAPALASAQIRASAGFSIDLPVVMPQLVVVTPGVQVVPDVDVEVFRCDGYYWTRHDGGWYRSANPRSGWVYAPRGVPPGLSRLPPGKYKHWRPEPGPGRGPVGAAFGPGPGPRAPAYGPGRYEDRDDDRHERYERHDRGDRDHGDRDRGDRGRGRGHGKHDD